MKRRLIVITLAVLALLALVCCAHAEFDPLKVTMELSSNRFTEPREITVTIKVINTGEDDMSGPVKLFYPNGRQVTEFGEPVLTVGASKSWTGKWSVTQAQLDARKLTFSIQYPIVNDAGQTVEKTLNFSKTLILESAIPQVVITRTITPTMATKGQTVTVVYEIANTGLIDIQNVKITENKSISVGAGNISEVKAGEKATYTFTAKMNTSNLTSSPAIRYEANGKTYTDSKEKVTITYRQVNLSASLKADKKGGKTGENVTLTLTLANSGKTPYENITVSDPTLGEIYSGLTLDAGETQTFEQTLPISETTTYLFSVTADDADGVTIDTATGQVTVTAIAPTELMNLTVTASADTDKVDAFPGSVNFTVSVTNNSAAEIKNVSVYVTGTDLKLYTFPTVEPGETRSFTRELVCSMSGNYQFQAKVLNQLGVTDTFASNNVFITRGAHTAETGSAGTRPVKGAAAVMPDPASLSDTELEAVITTLSGKVGDLTSLSENDLVTVLENAADRIPGLTEIGDEGRMLLARRAYDRIQAGAGESVPAAEGESGEVRTAPAKKGGFDFRALAWGLAVPAFIGTVLIIIGLIGRIKKAASAHKALDHMNIRGIRNYDVTEDDEQDAAEEEDHTLQEIDTQFEQAVEDAVTRRRRSAEARTPAAPEAPAPEAPAPEGVKPPEGPQA